MCNVQKSFDSSGSGVTEYLLSAGNKGMDTKFPESDKCCCDGSLSELVNPPSLTAHAE